MLQGYVYGGVHVRGLRPGDSELPPQDEGGPVESRRPLGARGDARIMYTTFMLTWMILQHVSLG